MIIITWLPFPDYRTSLECLSKEHLAKQIQDVDQILNTLLFIQKNAFLERGKICFGNHPVTYMWQDNIENLKLYCNLAKLIYKNKYNKDQEINLFKISKYLEEPWWIGQEILHLSHKSNLLKADYQHYIQFPEFREIKTDLQILWPKVISGKMKFVHQN